MSAKIERRSGWQIGTHSVAKVGFARVDSKVLVVESRAALVVLHAAVVSGVVWVGAVLVISRRAVGGVSCGFTYTTAAAAARARYPTRILAMKSPSI